MVYRRIAKVYNSIKYRFLTNKKFLESHVGSFDDYKEVQYRCEPKEFLEPRIPIISSFLFVYDFLMKYDLLKPEFVKPKLHGKELDSYHISYFQTQILDIGTRDGWFLTFLDSIGFKNVIGVELLREYVDYARKRNRNVIEGDIHKLPFDDNSFDLVYTRHTLEHTLNPTAALGEMIRVVKNKGLIYCSFPMESSPSGKHTVAFRSLRMIKNLLKEFKTQTQVEFLDYARSTNLIIPDHDEIVFLLKKIR